MKVTIDVYINKYVSLESFDIEIIQWNMRSKYRNT